jgi:hypothetical protein
MGQVKDSESDVFPDSPAPAPRHLLPEPKGQLRNRNSRPVATPVFPARTPFSGNLAGP